MPWFKKHRDPIDARSRALEVELTALRSQIRELSAQAGKQDKKPRVRSTAQPGARPTPSSSSVSVPAKPVNEPVFEAVTDQRLSGKADQGGTPAHYNELGVRKYDLALAWRRLRHLFHGPPTSNAKLVSYLATGTIKGLRPLRYEKRVARRRFLALTGLLLLLIWGILAMFATQ